MDTHMLIAVTCHPDGSLSSRIWNTSPARLDDIVGPLGEADAHTHLDTTARATVADAAGRVAAASVVVRREPGRMDS